MGQGVWVGVGSGSRCRDSGKRGDLFPLHAVSQSTPPTPLPPSPSPPFPSPSPTLPPLPAFYISTYLHTDPDPDPGAFSDVFSMEKKKTACELRTEMWDWIWRNMNMNMIYDISGPALTQIFTNCQLANTCELRHRGGWDFWWYRFNINIGDQQMDSI